MFIPHLLLSNGKDLVQPGKWEYHKLTSYDWSGYVIFPLTSIGSKCAQHLLNYGATMSPPEFPLVILHLMRTCENHEHAEVDHFYPSIHLLAQMTLRRSIELQAAQKQA